MIDSALGAPFVYLIAMGIVGVLLGIAWMVTSLSYRRQRAVRRRGGNNASPRYDHGLDQRQDITTYRDALTREGGRSS